MNRREWNFLESGNLKKITDVCIHIRNIYYIGYITDVCDMQLKEVEKHRDMEKNIRQCFSVADNIFAGHPIEIGFARKMLVGSAEHIEKLMKRIQDLNNYFEQD